MKNNSLAAGFGVRPITWSDLEAVQQVIYTACKADGTESLAPTLEELAMDWRSPDFNPATDAWVGTSPGGKVIGYEIFENRFAHASLQGDGYVDPEFLGLGVGSRLLELLEARARQEMPLAAPDLRVFIRNTLGKTENNARAIHEEAGFKPIRFSWQMEISLEADPPAAVWPQNIELRPFELARHDHPVYLADEEAFLDHWGHTPGTFETWQTYISGHPDFDPALWFIAWDGDRAAGYALCRLRHGIGWVGKLGVRPAWRKQGLGMALLKHSFRQFYAQGYTTIGLSVDASNPTGATRLYERAGMHVTSQFVTYEKELRPGREPDEENN